MGTVSPEKAAVSPGPDAPSVLAVRNLGFERGGQWLFRGLNLDVRPGEFVAVVGPSGVGKTTLLSCLCGLRPPSEGTVQVKLGPGPAASPDAHRSRYGIIFQQLQLTPNADLLTNVLCGRLARYGWWRTLRGFPREAREGAYALLRELEVGRDPHKWVAEMSGGEQQRVAVARALFQQPDIYFADEPVSSLDTYYAGRVLGMLRQEAHERGCVVFCVLHQAEWIARFADLALSLNPQDPTAWKVRRVRPATLIEGKKP